MPWDGSSSYGRALHRAHANHIFSQIKCSSVVKFEHIPGTQDEAQPLFPLYLPNGFKDRFLKQSKNKSFIFSLIPILGKSHGLQLKFSPKI